MRNRQFPIPLVLLPILALALLMIFMPRNVVGMTAVEYGAWQADLKLSTGEPITPVSVVADDTIVVVTGYYVPSGSDSRAVVLAYDAKKGTFLWEYVDSGCRSAGSAAIHPSGNFVQVNLYQVMPGELGVYNTSDLLLLEASTGVSIANAQDFYRGSNPHQSVADNSDMIFFIVFNDTPTTPSTLVALEVK